MKRALIDIGQDNRRQYEALRKHCKKLGKAVPSVGFLVRRAIERDMKATVEEFMGPNPEKK